MNFEEEIKDLLDNYLNFNFSKIKYKFEINKLEQSKNKNLSLIVSFFWNLTSNIKNKSIEDIFQNKHSLNLQIKFSIAKCHLDLTKRFLILKNKKSAKIQLINHIEILFQLIELQKIKINSFEKKYFLDLSDKFLKNLSYINSLNLNIRNQGFPKNITFVLGMHRSGTSALTGLLCKNKIFGFPEEKLEFDEHNQKGYWELKSIFINNDQLLRKYNLNWESINELPPDWIYDKHYPEWQNNFIEIIKKEFNGINKPIIKDPRLTYLFRGIKNWNESDELNFNILIPVRVPFEVIESIMVRKTLITSDKHNHFKFLEFYIENLFEVELSTRYMNRLFIDFEDLINKPNLVLNKCNIFFGNELHKIIKNYPFISKDLRHQNYRSRINNKNKRNFVESKLYKLALDLYKIFSSSYMNENAEVSLKKILKLKKEYFINYKKQKLFSE